MAQPGSISLPGRPHTIAEQQMEIIHTLITTQMDPLFFIRESDRTKLDRRTSNIQTDDTSHQF